MDTNKITDPLNRGMVAGILGMPADMVNMLRNAGRSVQNLTLMAQNKPTIPMQQDPAYGQEWWGNKLAQFGYVSPNRNAMAEFAAGLLDPTGIADNLAAKAPMLAQGLFNLGDPALMTVTKGLLAKKAYDVAPDVARAAAKNLSAPATLNKPGFAGQRGAIVWHGSPHTFDAFDASKIGTGEGAQAYGHGLYLAEKQGVAQEYADALGKEVLIKGKPAYQAKTGAQAADLPVSNAAAGHLRMNDWDLQKALKMAEEDFIETGDQWFAKVHKELSTLSPDDITVNRGQMYKVDLPDDAIARMLDWDKPLSQQAPEVRAGVRRVLIDRGQSPSVADYIVQNKTGRDALSTIGRGSYDARLLPPDGEAAAQSSNWLKAQGIPGIRYLDGGSRGTGSGTSNFVVFPGEEGLLKILERNGKPLK